MSNYDDRLQTEDWVTYFRRKNQFADVMLTAWCFLEYNLDMLFANEFGLAIDDEKAKILLDMNFRRKLDFLKDRVMNNEEYQAVKSFNELRNQLFHRDGWVYVHLSDAAKNDIMNAAVDSVKLLGAVINRNRTRADLGHGQR
jgi:hypothetical protein